MINGVPIYNGKPTQRPLNNTEIEKKFNELQSEFNNSMSSPLPLPPPFQSIKEIKQSEIDQFKIVEKEAIERGMGDLKQIQDIRERINEDILRKQVCVHNFQIIRIMNDDQRKIRTIAKLKICKYCNQTIPVSNLY